MFKVMIADASEDWRLALERALDGSYQVASCADGKSALTLFEQFAPDVLILDLMLPGVDGLRVLQVVAGHPRQPRVIVTGPHFSDFVTAALDRYQVDNAMVKPYVLQSMVDQIGELTASKITIHRLNPYDSVTALLLSLNVPTSQSGFRYLRDGILLLMDNPNQQLTKSLYPAIGKLYKTTGTNVEKCIRTTVTTAWKRRREEDWRKYFPLAPDGHIARPTSGQFLARMADLMSIDLRRQA